MYGIILPYIDHKWVPIPNMSFIESQQVKMHFRLVNGEGLNGHPPTCGYSCKIGWVSIRCLSDDLEGLWDISFRIIWQLRRDKESKAAGEAKATIYLIQMAATPPIPLYGPLCHCTARPRATNWHYRPSKWSTYRLSSQVHKSCHIAQFGLSGAWNIMAVLQDTHN